VDRFGVGGEPVVVWPGGEHAELLFDGAFFEQPRLHEGIERDHSLCGGQGLPVEPVEGPHEPGRRLCRAVGHELIGVDVHHPPHKRDASQAAEHDAGESGKRRAGADNDDIRPSHHESSQDHLNHEEQLPSEPHGDRLFPEA